MPRRSQKKHNEADEFAFLAIREYKKFVYLGVVSHYDVTPPKIIDQVWHEHQLFTRGYREFCQNVLEKNFDHSPELVALDDQNKLFSAQYNKTLTFYEHEFGTTPPPEIWGTTKYDPSAIKGKIEKPAKKTRDTSQTSSDTDTPLYTMFPSGSDAVYAPVPVTFSLGGGTFAGGGGGDDAGGGTQTSTPASAPASTSSCSSSTSSCSSSSSSCGGGGGSCGSS